MVSTASNKSTIVAKKDSVRYCSKQFPNLTHKPVHHYILSMAPCQLAYKPEDCCTPSTTDSSERTVSPSNRHYSWWDPYRVN